MDGAHVRAWIGTAVFLVVTPGTVAGLAPWLVLGATYPPLSWPAAVPGGLLILAGVALLLDAFVRFARQGVGTPAPIAPTQNLVVSGPYRFVRNPMYVAVLAIIMGQALAFLSWPVAIYGLVVLAAVTTFVVAYEEPTLTEQFGDSYRRYLAAVPRWLPRLTPYRDAPPPDHPPKESADGRAE